MSDKSEARERLEELYGEEFADWACLTPQERMVETCKLWEHYLQIGGSLDPEPDPQSPFYLDGEWSAPPLDGRPGLRVVRRGGI